VTGTFTLNLADVPASARGGFVMFDGNGGVQSVALTDAIRGGARTFELTVGEQPPTLVGGGGGSPGSGAGGTSQPAQGPAGGQSASAGGTSSGGNVGAVGPAGSGAVGPSEGPAGSGGVTPLNLPAVSSVLATTVLLQTGLTTTLTVHPGTGAEILGPAAPVVSTAQVTAAVQAVGGEDEADETDHPGGSQVSQEAHRAALERVINEVTAVGVLHPNDPGALLLPALRALLRAARARPARQPRVVPPRPEASQPPAAPQPPGPGAFWADPAAEAEPVLPAALADELAAVRCEDESPPALSSLLGLGLLAAGLCRPWWGGEDEERRRSEDDR
jgi:hypothetical protein